MTDPVRKPLTPEEAQRAIAERTAELVGQIRAAAEALRAEGLLTEDTLGLLEDRANIPGKGLSVGCGGRVRITREQNDYYLNVVLWMPAEQAAHVEAVGGIPAPRALENKLREQMGIARSAYRDSGVYIEEAEGPEAVPQRIATPEELQQFIGKAYSVLTKELVDAAVEQMEEPPHHSNARCHIDVSMDTSGKMTVSAAYAEKSPRSCPDCGETLEYVYNEDQLLSCPDCGLAWQKLPKSQGGGIALLTAVEHSTPRGGICGVCSDPQQVRTTRYDERDQHGRIILRYCIKCGNTWRVGW